MAEMPEVNCPACTTGTITMKTVPMDIPYFKDLIMTTIQCSDCGYRHSDIFIASQKSPMRYTFKITKPEDLAVRVVRSTTATYSIPELGIMVEPAVASQAFISNVEGILERMENAVGMASRFHKEDVTKVDKAQELLDAINAIRDGKMEVTLIIDDPMGNSAILAFGDGFNIEKRELTEAEVEALECPTTVLDKGIDI